MAMGQDLNTIVKQYRISRRGGVKELQELQERLRDVPVSLAGLQKELGWYRCDLSDTEISAEMYEPDGILLLGEFVEHEEAEAISARMVLPYPLITINTSPAHSKFFQRYRRHLGELILPEEGHPNARVLSEPSVCAVGIVFGRGNKLNYMEIILSGHPV